jgi:hypothetical protein
MLTAFVPSTCILRPLATRALHRSPSGLVEVQLVDRAADRSGSQAQHVGVDHGGPYVCVAEQLLDGPDVVSRLAEPSAATSTVVQPAAIVADDAPIVYMPGARAANKKCPSLSLSVSALVSALLSIGRRVTATCIPAAGEPSASFTTPLIDVDCAIVVDAKRSITTSVDFMHYSLVRPYEAARRYGLIAEHFWTISSPQCTHSHCGCETVRLDSRTVLRFRQAIPISSFRNPTKYFHAR